MSKKLAQKRADRYARTCLQFWWLDTLALRQSVAVAENRRRLHMHATARECLHLWSEGTVRGAAVRQGVAIRIRIRCCVRVRAAFSTWELVVASMHEALINTQQYSNNKRQGHVLIKWGGQVSARRDDQRADKAHTRRRLWHAFQAISSWVLAFRVASLACRAKQVRTRARQLYLTMRVWTCGIEHQRAALARGSRASHHRQQTSRIACMRYLFAGWAAEREEASTVYSRASARADLTVTSKSLATWWKVACAEPKDRKRAQRANVVSISFAFFGLWCKYRSDRKKLSTTAQFKRLHVLWRCLGLTFENWSQHTYAHIRVSLFAQRVGRSRHDARTLHKHVLAWSATSASLMFARYHVERMATRQTAAMLREIFCFWAIVLCAHSKPRLNLHTAQRLAAQLAQRKMEWQVFAICWRDSVREAQDDRRFAASRRRAWVLKAMTLWQSAVRQNLETATYVNTRAALVQCASQRAVAGLWRSVSNNAEQGRVKSLSRCSLRLQMLRLRSAWRRWLYECLSSQRCRNLEFRVAFGEVRRRFDLWRLQLGIRRVVNTELSLWWQNACVMLLPLTYNKAAQKQIFSAWKDLEQDAAYDNILLRPHALFNAISTWLRVSRLVMCIKLQADFSTALVDWQSQVAISQEQLLKASDMIAAGNRSLQICMMEHWSVRTKQQCALKKQRRKILAQYLQRLYFVSRIERHLSCVEVLACGQMFARKAVHYFRFLVFACWKMATRALTISRALLRRCLAYESQVSLQESLASWRKMLKQRQVKSRAISSQARRYQRRVLRAWTQTTWISIRGSDVIHLQSALGDGADYKGVGARGGWRARENGCALGDSQRMVASPKAFSASPRQRLIGGWLDPFHAHPTQELVSALVSRCKGLQMAMALKEWASVTNVQALARRFQCRAMLKADHCHSVERLRQVLTGVCVCVHVCVYVCVCVFVCVCGIPNYLHI